MKQYIFLISIFFLVLSATAQTKETIDQKQANYVGQKSMHFFKQQPHAKWFNESYEAYELDKKTLKKLENYVDGVKIKVFMSVWCHDSHREIPRLFKILEAINFDEQNLEIVALNRAKKTPDNLQKGFNIKRTPTLIFYKNEKEINRFVEQSKKSLEKDILKILSGKNYKHRYFNVQKK